MDTKITQPDPYHKPINIDIGDDYQCYIYIYMHDLIYILHTIATIYKAIIYVKPTIIKDWDRIG